VDQSRRMLLRGARYPSHPTGGGNLDPPIGAYQENIYIIYSFGMSIGGPSPLNPRGLAWGSTPSPRL
jgi:hypothetical protein